jgi:signal peptidase I
MTKLRRWIVRLLMALAVALPLGAIALYAVNPFGANSYDPRQRIIGYGPYRVPSRSMAPTVNPDQIVIMRAGYYSNHEPRRGDIVIFIHQQDGNHWIKRVVGLPGERIAIEDGVVRIDGRELVEDMSPRKTWRPTIRGRWRYRKSRRTHTSCSETIATTARTPAYSARHGATPWSGKWSLS